MNFVGFIDHKKYGTIQLWEMSKESKEEWNERPDDSHHIDRTEKDISKKEKKERSCLKK